MKVVSPQQMSSIESHAYRDGSSESDFMEEAGNGVAIIAHEFCENNNHDRHISILCGKGNNAGDAYVAGIQLMHLDYEVTVHQLFPINECSQLCRQNHFMFLSQGGYVKSVAFDEELDLPEAGIIIDGIFGTGFRGAVDEPLASIILKANQSQLPIISIDIPSGLNGKTGKVETVAIVATITAFLGLPKTGFFLLDGWNYVGKLAYINFGLSDKYIDEAESDLIMLSPEIMKPLMPPLVRNRHKYQAGHVVGLAGSKAMPGAAMLASLAALTSGAGIVHLLYPTSMENELLASPYELLKVPYTYENPQTVIDLLNRASAGFIGPGLGLSQEVKELLRTILPEIQTPVVLDADALNFIAQEQVTLPPHSILTPHLGELKRLMDIPEAQLDMNFLRQCQKFATDTKTTLVLKGGPSFIFQADAPIFVNPRGDPGMATAGSGDVLTGLIASLLAQKLKPIDAATLGVFLHGIAGEYAARDLTSYCVTASDIMSFFADALRPNNWTI